MAVQTGRLIGRITSYVTAGVFFAAGLIVGLIPYSSGGYSSVCPSAIVSLAGGRNSGQSVINMFSGGRCDDYASTMTVIMTILMLLGLLALVGGILLRKRRDAAATAFAGGPQGQFNTYAAPAMPGHAPVTAEHSGQSPHPDSSYPDQANHAPAASTSGSFDTKLLVAGLIAVAGVVLLSFVVDWLGFLPGIIELLLWTAVGLTGIWQLKRRFADSDERKLAEAEAWNPAVVARGVVAAGRGRLEAHRAQRREAERSQANAFAQQGAQEPEFRGDDGMSRPDVP